MTSFDPWLLTPPKEEEAKNPYRRVWFSIIVETAWLFVVVSGFYFITHILGTAIPVPAERITGGAFALIPALLWIKFSWRAEHTAPEPRKSLATVFIVSALVATAVGEPIIHSIFQVRQWLPGTGTLTRILGYTFTIGITQESLKYLVVRYMVWPTQYRIRLDSVAYLTSSAIGYATATNLQRALAQDIAAGTALFRVFDTTVIHVATGIIIAYGLSEIRFGRSAILLPVITVGLAATLSGFTIAFRANLINAGLSLEVSASNPILGFIFSTGIFIITIAIFSFLYDIANRTS